MNFNNKIVLITGATGGLGSAVTGVFLRAGAGVAATHTGVEKFKELETALKPEAGKLLGIKTNVLDSASVKRMTGTVMEKFGRIDALVNLAGGYLGGISIADLNEKQWDDMINLNLKSVFLVCKQVLPVMMKQKSGRIVNITSGGGLQGAEGISAYGASKAGVINITQTLAAEGKKFNISANAVAPGIIDTPANRAAMPGADFSKWVKPESLAEVILFLCSGAARDVSGTVVPVMGKAG
jgi:NAD(P)-dependent dehydrogenase (short-subunit alcohol dehydrogenase family)